MKHIKQLTRFYDVIRDDPRIAPTHISLYMALFQLYISNGFRDSVSINRKDVMATAKITGKATFHKCIRDLHDFEFIRYYPSYCPRIRSYVNIVQL